MSLKFLTDLQTLRIFSNPKDPEKCNIFSLFQSFANKKEINDLSELYHRGSIGYGEAKQICFEKLNSELKGPREVYYEIRNDKTKLRGILEAGRDKARVIAKIVNKRIREKVGI